MKKLIVLAVLSLLVVSSAFAAEGDIKLPAPEKTGGIGVLDVVAARQSVGDFVDTELTPEQLSTLLWVAGGINRDNGKLTYATAFNIQDAGKWASLSRKTPPEVMETDTPMKTPRA